jgi:hypothetical protein
MPLTIEGRLFLPDFRNILITTVDNLPVPIVSDYIDIHPVVEKLISQNTVRYVAPLEDVTLSQI